METLELILFLVAAVVASSVLDKLLPRLSLPLVQIALGALIAVFVTTPLESGIDPELLLILFIAPLHFNESKHADSGQLWSNRWGIASLAMGLVFAIVVSVGFTLHALLPAIPLAAALALGAAMGSTDAVAVMELSKDFRFGKRHESLLSGEAFFNDVTGTVVFQCAMTVAVSGTFSIMHAGEEFALDLFGGMLGGIVMGFAAWALLELIKRCGVDSPTLHVTLELLLPFLIYLISEHIHVGGVIAVVMAGMVMSLLPHKHTAQTARQKLQSRGVWDTISFVLNGAIFVILGMQLPRVLSPTADGGLGDLWTLIGIMIALTLVLEGIRFIWILGMDAVHHIKSDQKSGLRGFLTKSELKGALAMAFAGPKGGITLSLMLTTPYALSVVGSFPVRDALVSIVSGVILCTLLLANFAVPALATHKATEKKTRERTDIEVGLILDVLRTIQEDSRMTGLVKSDMAFDGDNPQSIDEPATVIVMKRYSDRLEDLIPHASTANARKAREAIDRISALYEYVGDIAEQIDELDAEPDSEGKGDSSTARRSNRHVDNDKRPSLTTTFKLLRQTYDAVEDIQSQALNRELELIKQLKNNGEITPNHARELRNDVYIQQLTL